MNLYDIEGAQPRPFNYWRSLMAETKKSAAKKAPAKSRARTETGAFKSDDPSTPDVNEAWEQKPAPKKEYVYYESREKEPFMFPVADIRAIRNFQTGRLEYKVEASDVERFEKHHFVMNARIIRKA